MSSAIDVISHLLRRRWEGGEGQKVIVRLFDTVVNSNKGGGSFLSLPQLVCIVRCSIAWISVKGAEFALMHWWWLCWLNVWCYEHNIHSWQIRCTNWPLLLQCKACIGMPTSLTRGVWEDAHWFGRVFVGKPFCTFASVSAWLKLHTGMDPRQTSPNPRQSLSQNCPPDKNVQFLSSGLYFPVCFILHINSHFGSFWTNC